jgi:hypothetical protein
MPPRIYKAADAQKRQHGGIAKKVLLSQTKYLTAGCLSDPSAK